MTTSDPFHVLGISGSLRKASYNTALLRAAAELMPAGMTLETFDLVPLPMFNQDAEKPFPGAVVEFRTRQNGAAGCSGAMGPKDCEFAHPFQPWLDGG